MTTKRYQVVEVTDELFGVWDNDRNRLLRTESGQDYFAPLQNAMWTAKVKNTNNTNGQTPEDLGMGR